MLISDKSLPMDGWMTHQRRYPQVGGIHCEETALKYCQLVCNLNVRSIKLICLVDVTIITILLYYVGSATFDMY